MHLEILVEDNSGKTVLQTLLPKILPRNKTSTLTWNIHSYKGEGKLPPNLKPRTDASKRILLDHLPKKLRGFAKTPGVDAVIIVLDVDTRHCKEFLRELYDVADLYAPHLKVMFRLAIEEMEAWYLGDRNAVLAAYPKAKTKAFQSYTPDAICGTWELLADALHPGGVKEVKKKGWPRSGDLKHEWARSITPHMNVEANLSPSFIKFRDGLRRITSSSEQIA